MFKFYPVKFILENQVQEKLYIKDKSEIKVKDITTQVNH